MKKYAVIVAGGIGQRMGADIPKQFLLLQNKPILWHTLQTFLLAFIDLQIILVLPKDNLSEGENLCKDLHAEERISLTIGGTTRFHSVQNGLALVKDPSIVFVHDGVRCLVSQNLIHRCYAQTLERGSAVPAVSATDSIRIVDEYTHKVANRNQVRILQTPQTFLSALLLPAYQQSYQESFTDEATVLEAYGHEVMLIEGEYENIKITRPTDLLIAQSFLTARLSKK